MTKLRRWPLPLTRGRLFWRSADSGRWRLFEAATLDPSATAHKALGRVRVQVPNVDGERFRQLSAVPVDGIERSCAWTPRGS